MIRRRPAFAALVALCLGCAGPEAPGPNVLLVSLDTVRADHTSLLGYARPTTPHLERLAAEGVSFTRAYAMTSTTGPTHGTLFTGRYAPAHGVRHNGMPLAPAETTLAEHLAARGYRTAGFVSAFVLSRRFGFAQGFEIWDERFSAETSSLPMGQWEGHAVPGKAFDRTGRETTDRAVAWLEGLGPERFFLFVHYFDAHEPYAPRPDLAARFAADDDAPAALTEVARYDAEVAQVDAEVGRLLAALDGVGRAEDTIVVVVSDHGQGLLDHDDPYHSVNLYEESVRSLFVLRWPRGLAAGRELDAPVEQVDVLPTVLDWLAPGSHAALGLPGRSLAPLLAGRETLPGDRPVFLYRQWYPERRRVRGVDVGGEQFGVRVGDWKYIEGTRDGRRELYDLATDPRELDDRTREASGHLDRLERTLAAWREQHTPAPRRAPHLSDEERAGLRALGYAE